MTTVEAEQSSRHFGTEHLMADLKGRSVRGGAVTLSTQALKFVLNLGFTAVLARLLTPADFGLMAMVAAFTGFVALFMDMGLSTATVQRERITHDQVSTLFWINVALSVLLMGVAASLAPVVAWFYGEPKLLWIMLAVAGTFIFGGLTAQHIALLQRQMRFAALSGLGIVTMIVANLVGIAMAWYGFGYWALVAMGAVGAATAMVLCWVLSGWRPGRPRPGSGVRPMLAFGGNLTGSTLLQYLNRNFDNLLIGWWWGAAALGIYARAYALLLMPIRQVNGPMSSIALPALSRLQNDPDRYRRFYRKAVQFIVFLGMPIVAMSFVAADKIVLLVLGNQWLDAVPIFRALAPAAFIGTFNVATGWVFMSMGHTNRQLRLALVNCILILTAMLIGVRYGAFGVAVAYSSTVVALRLPHIIYCFWPTPLRVTDLLGALFMPFIASIGAAAGLFIFNELLSVTGPLFVSLSVDLLVYAALYVAILISVPEGRRLLRAVTDLQRDLRHRNREASCP